MATQLKLRHVDRSDPTPRYLQAQRILTEAIRVGNLPAGMKLPSTKDIGSLVKVSLITAHKALGGLVDAGLLRREVGYGTFVRDDVHEAITAKRHFAVGLVLDPRVNLNDFYHSAILNELRQVARLDADRVEFYFQDGFRAPHRRWASQTGVICIHPPLEAQARVARLAATTPTVVLGGSFSGGRVVCVDCDNRSGGAAQSVQHLFGLGHRRYLLVSGPTNLSNARDRLEGVRQALAVLGVELDEQSVLISNDSVNVNEETTAAIRRRLGRRDRPTAIIAGGYYLALATMHVIHQAGLSIPHDVSVVGFDDPEAAPLLNPPLTTVRQPLKEMAGQAFGLLRDLIAGDLSEPSTILLPTQLILRQTTGPAPR